MATKEKQKRRQRKWFNHGAQFSTGKFLGFNNAFYIDCGPSRHERLSFFLFKANMAFFGSNFELKHHRLHLSSLVPFSSISRAINVLHMVHHFPELVKCDSEKETKFWNHHFDIVLEIVQGVAQGARFIIVKVSRFIKQKLLLSYYDLLCIQILMVPIVNSSSGFSIYSLLKSTLKWVSVLHQLILCHLAWGWFMEFLMKQIMVIFELTALASISLSAETCSLRKSDGTSSCKIFGWATDELRTTR